MGWPCLPAPKECFCFFKDLRTAVILCAVTIELVAIIEMIVIIKFLNYKPDARVQQMWNKVGSELQNAGHKIEDEVQKISQREGSSEMGKNATKATESNDPPGREGSSNRTSARKNTLDDAQHLAEDSYKKAKDAIRNVKGCKGFLSGAEKTFGKILGIYRRVLHIAEAVIILSCILFLVGICVKLLWFNKLYILLILGYSFVGTTFWGAVIYHVHSSEITCGWDYDPAKKKEFVQHLRIWFTIPAAVLIVFDLLFIYFAFVVNGYSTVHPSPQGLVRGVRTLLPFGKMPPPPPPPQPRTPPPPPTPPPYAQPPQHPYPSPYPTPLPQPRGPQQPYRF